MKKWYVFHETQRDEHIAICAESEREARMLLPRVWNDIYSDVVEVLTTINRNKSVRKQFYELQDKEEHAFYMYSNDEITEEEYLDYKNAVADFYNAHIGELD